MSVITVVKGEEFKISVKEEITEDDIFINEYRRAADMLDEITGASRKEKDLDKPWSWKQGDFENNVIAFCGERGVGKSSAMLTFANAVCKEAGKMQGIFSSCHNLERVHFAEPILIDPTLFDDVHNVLDIVLAKIFKKFYDKYNEGAQRNNDRVRERLLDQFQRVYRYVSLINNQKQMLDCEFDYEGNISTLTKLGESTNLKEELARLIFDYLEFMNEGNAGDCQLILAIDDLDLCSANAYKMAEQIRKYLIIPHVLIVISVKIDQLELCIREQNLHDFKKLYKNKDQELYRRLNKEVQVMAERYVSKLIPKIRRIYLPRVQSFQDIRLVYYNNGKELWDSRKLTEGKNTAISAMLKLIYQKTGMRFLPGEGGGSYLLPDNLRDMISWIVMFANLKEPRDSRDAAVYYKNIVTFGDFYTRVWAEDPLNLYGGLTLQELRNMDSFHLHVTVQRILNQFYMEIYGAGQTPFTPAMPEQPDSFFQVMHLFDLLSKTVLNREKEAFVYQLRTLYTIRMNSLWRSQAYDEMAQFLNGYLWGPWFSGVLPQHQGTNIDRSRFFVEPIQAYNLILEELYINKGNLVDEWELKKMFLEHTQIKLLDLDRGAYLRHIPEGGERKAYIKAWILLGLFSNVYYYNNNQLVYSSAGTMIYNNSKVCEYVQISLENYLTGLCNLESLYDKVNLDVLGVERDEFKAIIHEIAEANMEQITCARELASNMDSILHIKDYCVKNRDYKEKTETDTERSAKLAEKFFANIVSGMGDLQRKYDYAKLREFYYEEKRAPLQVANLYAKLFDLCVRKYRTAEELVSEFRKKLTEIPQNWHEEENRAYKTLRNLSADNVKKNLDKLALGVEKYLGERRMQPAGMNLEGLCDLYQNVAELYLQDKEARISQEWYQEYRNLVLFQDNMDPER